MKNFVKKYVGDKAFYKTVLAIALPIMLQNGITNFVSLLDNIMVGQVGTEQMSGVAIVNQLIFVFNLMVFGTMAAGGIFTSQYHGKGNVDGVRQTFRFKLIAGTVILAVAVLIFALFGKQLISLYLNDGSQEGDLELTLPTASTTSGLCLSASCLTPSRRPLRARSGKPKKHFCR